MVRKINADTKVQYLKGVGPKRARLFNSVGIVTVEDLIYHFPRRYEDRSNLLPISRLQEGKMQTIRAHILSTRQRRSWRRRGFNIFEIIAGDSTGRISCVWFNQPYLKNYIKIGRDIILYGRVERYSGRLQMVSPEFEIVSDKDNAGSSSDIAGLTPIYKIPDGLTQRYFRRILRGCLEEYLPEVVDVLPYDIRVRNNLLNLAKSLLEIHFPPDMSHLKESYRRISFEEFFLFQIPLILKKLRKKQKQGISHKVDAILLEEFQGRLNFKLTPAQTRVIEEIKKDMSSSYPMSRLLQGDVGSGKTIVALFACLIAIRGGYQAAIMVPTELLARQHYYNSSLLLKDINIVLLVSSLAPSKKIRTYNEIKEGRAQLIIGTHALLEGRLNFKRLGLVVIDEEHKFGVSQRAFLPKRGSNPDVLIMTATPIPRTLAITLYGDLDISVIDEVPPGRKPVVTKFVTDEQRYDVYRFVESKIREGRQAYIIYPIIEESCSLDLRAANQMYLFLKDRVFPDCRVGLVHGQLNAKQQHGVMSEFKAGNIDILVATTVLEVGIDVPNASVMVIEHAERFGLSQLHQLRGRIGRGEFESYCILISQSDSEEARMRIEAMVEYSDGFCIAEEDLKIRGPGEFFGKRQHGLSELRIANPLTQLQLLKRARHEAKRLLRLDPNLEWRQNSALKRKLSERFPGYENYIAA